MYAYDSLTNYSVHRWYDSGTGRYERPDPIRRESNDYAYVTSRPTFYVDALGLVTSQGDCGCCDEYSKEAELEKAATWVTTHWQDYSWSPKWFWEGKSCLDSADALHNDLENNLRPGCFVTSVQLTKGLGADLVKATCGTYFPVHFVVKFQPCDGKGDNWYFNGYTGPDFGPLDPGTEIDEP